MTRLKLEYLGTHWEWSGDLFYMGHPDGTKATVSVDSLGELWVVVSRIPEGGYFHTERVDSWREFNGSARAYEKLKERGYVNRRNAPFAHRVRERDL